MNITFNADSFADTPNINFGNIKSNITANAQNYMLNSVPKLFVSGEYHFERYPHEQWEEEILKMKAAGVDIISSYIVWLFHEEHKDEYNFTGNYDDRHFLSLCKKHNMCVIMRIGPWVHAELCYGGFPEYIQRLSKKRSNDPEYLSRVRKYWTKLYNETKDFFDGETVIAIQIDNEYIKGMEHLITLKELACDVGFKAPIFTVTGWGYAFDGDEFQGTYGGYPAMPWAGHSKKLDVQGNFTIRYGYHSESDIGQDIIDYNKSVKENKESNPQPIMTCECGCGNQVTEKRREIISANDAYGVPFATIANGCSFLGYYMFHGSSNPRGGLYQESRKTSYPNNCPIIDYDFQAPLSRYGAVRQSCKLLKCLNYMCNYYGSTLAAMPTFYSNDLRITKKNDSTTPRICVRADKNGRGFVFASTYERQTQLKGLDNININVNTICSKLSLPPLTLEPNVFAVYPFNIDLSGEKYKYITAMPVAKNTVDGKTTYYFKEIHGMKPIYSTDVNGEFAISQTTDLLYNKINDNADIVVMSEKIADDFYIINNKIIFTNAVVYGDDKLTVEYKNGDYCIINGNNVKLNTYTEQADILLARQKPFPCKYKHYLFSGGKKEYYKLTVKSPCISGNISDCIIDFDFGGNTLQTYHNGELIDDLFNYDGTYRLSLKYYMQELTSDQGVDIVTAAFPLLHSVYTETEFNKKSTDLRIKNITYIYKKVM